MRSAMQQGKRGGRLSSVSPLLWKVAKGDAASALDTLRSTREGLSASEVERRSEEYGKNEVAHEKPPAWWMQFAKAFYNPFILVLVVLGFVSYVTDVVLPTRDVAKWQAEQAAQNFGATAHGAWVALTSAQPPDGPNWTKVIILAVMISVSGVLRFWQEFRSTKAAERLKALVRTTATVSRQREETDETTPDGPPGFQVKMEVPMADLVPGDIVHLSAGDMVPADVRLLSSKDLFVSQSVLTGEAMPVEKYDTIGNVVEKSAKAAVEEQQANPLDMGTLCFMGTNIISGTATAVVAATGRHTFYGALAVTVLGQRPMTSFDIGVNKVSFLLVKFMLVMVPIVMAINGFTKGNWKEAFLFGLAVAVGLTPEMLPLVVSANLAKGAVKMSKHKVIVKRLNSIQNFGAMDVLCTDKTGTLTEDKVVLLQCLDIHGKSSKFVLEKAYLNSVFQTGLKNLLDHAVIEKAGEKAIQDLTRHYEKIDEIPFDFTRRRMSVVLTSLARGDRLLICKGAVHEMLSICTKVHNGGDGDPLTETIRASLIALLDSLNADGLRVLAVAYKPIEKADQPLSVHDENELILAGYITFLDPPKPSAREAISALAAHGVSVKVITGDNAIIAAKVCREVGLQPGEAVTSHEIENLSDDELGALAVHTTLFVRMNPLQKARVIRALKARGHTVGYMGDGINDSAALRDADVGISVDTAVDIAKESADIILLEKSLMVLEEGIIEGRIVFGNIIKYIKMTASSNFGNVFSVLVASAFLPFLPMLALQLLIQNLLYDFSQLSLPWDRMDKEFLVRPRKWESAGLARFMIFIGPISSIFDITTFALLWYVFGANSPAHQSLFQSGWFVEGLLSQTLIVHMIRTQKIPFIQSTASLPVMLLTGVIMALGILLPFTDFGAKIGLQPLPGSYFPWLVVTLLAYCVLTQIVKTWFIHRFGRWL